MKIDKNRQGYKSRQNIKMMYLKGLKQVILTFWTSRIFIGEVIPQLSLKIIKKVVPFQFHAV